ncbi:MAG: hypothetical protein WBZ37_04380 [Mycobacterium sp.]
MASSNPAEHQEIATTAAYAQWANTADRAARLGNAHVNSPSGYNYHARRLFGQDVDLDKLTETQWAKVADARLAYLRAMAMKATRARRLKRAQALREKADAIVADVEAGEAP